MEGARRRRKGAAMGVAAMAAGRSPANIPVPSIWRARSGNWSNGCFNMPANWSLRKPRGSVTKSDVCVTRSSVWAGIPLDRCHSTCGPGRLSLSCAALAGLPAGEARSSVVEHYLDMVGVGSSILPAPTRNTRRPVSAAFFCAKLPISVETPVSKGLQPLSRVAMGRKIAGFRWSPLRHLRV